MRVSTGYDLDMTTKDAGLGIRVERELRDAEKQLSLFALPGRENARTELSSQAFRRERYGQVHLLTDLRLRDATRIPHARATT